MSQTSSSVSRSQKLFFGFGHVLNDMCASLWFNYLLVFFHSVLLFNNAMAGSLLLVGQVADALTTPVVGIESDRVSLCGKYGKRKSWHLFGTIMVFVSFAFIFNPCLPCNKFTSDWAQFIYFAPIIVIFQIGWASTQISHLSLIPTLSHCEHERVELTSIRYAFTVASNFVVFGSVSALLTFMPVSPVSKDHVPTDVFATMTPPNKSIMPVETGRLSPADVPIFRYLSFITVAVGVLFSIAFHIGVKEPVEEAEARSPEIQNSTEDDEARDEMIASTIPLTASSTRKMTAMEWFKEPHFYLVALIYICVRLITNVSQVYMSLFINDTLMLDKRNVAFVPLTIFAMSMVTSFGQKKLNSIVGRTFTLGLGMVICVGYSVIIYFIEQGDSLVKIYAAAIVLGLGTSVLMIGSLSLTADMIGTQCQTSAFVYGIMSFGDKMSNGIAVEVIQLVNPKKINCSENQILYRIVEIYVIGGISVFGLFLVLILARRKIHNLRFYGQIRNSNSVNNYNSIPES